MNRILFVSTVEAYWGGSEVLWSAAALATRKAGDAAAAYFPFFKDVPQTRQLAAGGVRLFHGTPPPIRWWRRWLQPSLNRDERFHQALQHFKPTLVLINQGAARDGLSEMASCRARGVRYAILNQAVEPALSANPRLAEIRESFERAEHVWCVSRENLALLRASLGCPLVRATSVPNAYGCAFDVAPSWPEQSDPARFAAVARLEIAQKGQDLLLEALAAPKWRTRDVHVTFFGDGPDRAALQARCAALQLERVDLSGRSASVAKIWHDHHLLILPSRFEGQSLAMIEAMLHGRPVVATPVGGTTDVVLDGQTGFLAASIDATALDAAMERAWQARANWRQLGDRARDHIRRHVSPNPGPDFAARLAALGERS
jgi:glycosyltransferase involved in cell wall biosynthesis